MPTTDLSDDRVLTSQQVAELTSISVPVLERWRTAGTGPRFIRLSARRVGYRLADLRAWMAARAGGGEHHAA